VKFSAFVVTVFGAALTLGTAQAQTSLESLNASAAKGDGEAEWNLGMKYDLGEGVGKNPERAFCWIHRSAEHGYISAWQILGIMYSVADGVAKDYTEAYKWFYLVQTLEPPSWPAELRQDATNDAGKIATEMTPAQIAEAKQRARDWWDQVKARGPRQPGQHYVPVPNSTPDC
jgi:hypothetical protein